MVDKKRLLERLYKIGGIKFGTFTLKSGATSPVYIDLRQIVSYPDLLRDIATAMWAQVASINKDLICGVPYTALPIATCMSLEHNMPMLLVRKEQKDYGTKKMVEGVFDKGQTCLVVEDVITSGGSVLTTCELLTTTGVAVKDIVVFIDRCQGGNENIVNKGYHLHAVMTLPEVLELLPRQVELNDEERAAIASFT